MARRFFIVDVFAERPYAGNQLAVVVGAADLSDEAMQQIALETNYSETTFVTSAPEADGGYRVRMFTPAREIAFCRASDPRHSVGRASSRCAGGVGPGATQPRRGTGAGHLRIATQWRRGGVVSRTAGVAWAYLCSGANRSCTRHIAGRHRIADRRYNRSRPARR